MKTCTKCGKLKELADFPKRSSSKDGRRTDCRVCYDATIKAWRMKNIGKVREYANAWAKRNPENALKHHRSARKRNPEKFRAEYKKWYDANKEQAAAATRAWLSRHPEWAKRYRENNKDVLRQKSREWQLNNPVKVREKSRRYQASRIGATPAWLNAVQLAQLQEFYEIAEALETQTGIKHHVDHIYPLNGENLCGLHVPWNLQVLRYDENIRKSNKIPEIVS